MSQPFVPCREPRRPRIGESRPPRTIRPLAEGLEDRTVLTPFVAAYGGAFYSTEGQSGTGTIAEIRTLVEGQTSEANQLQIHVDWGDGQTSDDPNIVVNGIYIDIIGTHTYEEEGTKTIEVSITFPGGSGTIVVNGTAYVSDAPITASLVHNFAQVNQPFSGTVAKFADANPGATANDFSTEIWWGDGSDTDFSGRVASDGQGGFRVIGTHGYSQPGIYSVWVDVIDAGGSSAEVMSTIEVSLTGETTTQTPTATPPATAPPPNTVPQLPLPFPNIGPPTKAVDLTHPGAKSNRSIDQEAERLANGVVKEINSLLRAGAAVADFAKLTPAAKAQLVGSAIDGYTTELKHNLAAARRDPAGAAARWLGSVVRDTVKTLSDNNAAESAGRQVVRTLFSKATGSLGASKSSKGVGHIIKPVAGAGTAALEGGLEKAAIRYFASHGEKILRSKIGRSSRGIDVASYVGQGIGARLIISESKNLGGLVPGKSLTALGSGKQGVDRVNLKRLESNLAAIRRSIENQVQDPTTRQTLLAQLDPGSQTGPILRLVGNMAKGTSFDESAIQEIVRDVSGVVKFQWPPIILNLTVPK